MESNISRDHIALEAMKFIMNIDCEKRQTIWNKILVLFGGQISKTVQLTNAEKVAELAYRYADAMIAEREKNDGSR